MKKKTYSGVITLLTTGDVPWWKVIKKWFGLVVWGPVVWGPPIGSPKMQENLTLGIPRSEIRIQNHQAPNHQAKPLVDTYQGTPWKINMEPTNYPFIEENELPNIHDYVPC